jgi:type I restriction enzyme S subunit
MEVVLLSLGRGGAQANINQVILRHACIPLPPLAEQHRIVAKVDELMGHAKVLEERHLSPTSTRVRLRDAALHALAEAEDHAAAETAWSRIEDHFEDLFTEPEDVTPLRQAILQLAVRGRLVGREEGDEAVVPPPDSKRFDQDVAWDVPWVADDLPPQWRCLSLDALGEWASGGTPSRANPAYYGAGTPWLKISDLNYGRVMHAEESITDAGLEDSAARMIPVDAVLIAMYGSIGKCGIAGIRCCSNQAIAHCICNRDLVVPDFLLLEARAMEVVLLSLGRGGAQANINQVILRHACIPLPPLAEQHRIVAKVDELMALCDTLETSLMRAKACREQFAGSISAALGVDPPETPDRNAA